jgi:aspartyl/asparaginyl-tRNA synthetase
MKDISVKEIFDAPNNYADKEVQVSGWVRTNRSSNRF